MAPIARSLLLAGPEGIAVRDVELVVHMVRIAMRAAGLAVALSADPDAQLGRVSELRVERIVVCLA